MSLSPFSWLRQWSKAAVLSGVADALDDLTDPAHGDAARRLAALAAPPAAGLPAAGANGGAEPARPARGGGRGGR